MKNGFLFDFILPIQRCFLIETSLHCHANFSNVAISWMLPWTHRSPRLFHCRKHGGTIRPLFQYRDFYAFGSTGSIISLNLFFVYVILCILVCVPSHEEQCRHGPGGHGMPGPSPGFSRYCKFYSSMVFSTKTSNFGRCMRSVFPKYFCKHSKKCN